MQSARENSDPGGSEILERSTQVIWPGSHHGEDAAGRWPQRQSERRRGLADSDLDRPEGGRSTALWATPSRVALRFGQEWHAGDAASGCARCRTAFTTGDGDVTVCTRMPSQASRRSSGVCCCGVALAEPAEFDGYLERQRRTREPHERQSVQVLVLKWVGLHASGQCRAGGTVQVRARTEDATERWQNWARNSRAHRRTRKVKKAV